MTFEEFRKFKPTKHTYARFGGQPADDLIPELHSRFFEASGKAAEYYDIEVPSENLKEALVIAKKKLKGINLAYPHQAAVIPLLDEIDPAARALGLVTTVTFRKNTASGCNTDIPGFADSLTLDGIALEGAKVLLLCSKGPAPAMAYYCAQKGAQLTLTDRNLSRADTLRKQLSNSVPGADISVFNSRHIPRDIQIVLNATSIGMFPKETTSPLHFLPRKTSYVFDTVFNPPVTATMKLANPRHTQTRDGLYMLVMQAAHSHRMWYGADFDPSICKTIMRRMYGQIAVKRLHEKHGKKNIVLCGFMGSGKTTIGRKLARLTGLEFFDSDQYIEQREGKNILELFREKGESYFRELEIWYVRELAQKNGIVLSLGGGSVISPENVEAVKESGLLIYLDTPYHRIVQNLAHSYTRPLLDKPNPAHDTRRLYNARKAIYRRVSDCSVRSARISEVLDHVVKSI